MVIAEIKPKNEFSFIRLPDRGRLPERAQLLENFTPSSSGSADEVRFYKLLRSPSDPPEGKDSPDLVDTLGPDNYQPKLDEIAKDVEIMSRKFLGTPSDDTMRTRTEWGQYLNVMYLYILPPRARLTSPGRRLTELRTESLVVGLSKFG